MKNIEMIAEDSAIVRVAVFDSLNRPYSVQEMLCYMFIYLGDPDAKQYQAEVNGNVLTVLVPKGVIYEAGAFPYEIVITDGENLQFTIVQGTITAIPRIKP